ncbi:MAG: zf-TFIIB domain-containing protein [Armatimonadetes bacterium]|nr:zf-TFIIB domain-containing protein [Armatimonadota bacterium]
MKDKDSYMMDKDLTPSRKKAATQEDEYFAKKDRELLEAGKVRDKEEEKKLLRELHYMHCPKCGYELEEVSRKGVQVDRCTECGGIWLDPGELEILLSHEDIGIMKGILKVFSKGSTH